MHGKLVKLLLFLTREKGKFSLTSTSLWSCAVSRILLKNVWIKKGLLRKGHMKCQRGSKKRDRQCGWICYQQREKSDFGNTL